MSNSNSNNNSFFTITNCYCVSLSKATAHSQRAAWALHASQTTTSCMRRLPRLRLRRPRKCGSSSRVRPSCRSLATPRALTTWMWTRRLCPTVACPATTTSSRGARSSSVACGFLSGRRCASAPLSSPCSRFLLRRHASAIPSGPSFSCPCAICLFRWPIWLVIFFFLLDFSLSLGILPLLFW